MAFGTTFIWMTFATAAARSRAASTIEEKSLSLIWAIALSVGKWKSAHAFAAIKRRRGDPYLGGGAENQMPALSTATNDSVVFAGFAAFSRAKAELDAKLSIPPFVLHDLRRSAASYSCC